MSPVQLRKLVHFTVHTVNAACFGSNVPQTRQNHTKTNKNIYKQSVRIYATTRIDDIDWLIDRNNAFTHIYSIKHTS